MDSSGGRANRPGEPPQPIRKPMGHEIPNWVKSGEIYFVTICVQDRRSNPLLQGKVAQQLIDSAAHLHQLGKWHLRLFLVMPDHVHALISFPPENSLQTQISAWKSYTAKKFAINWQERFFEHRIRSDESLDEKCHCIMMNPARAGLIAENESWPYILKQT